MNDPYVPSSSQSSFHGGGPSSPSSTFPGTTAADYRFHPSQFRTLMNSHLASGAPGQTFTPQMRDRQARGKDPYTSGNGTDDGEMSDPDLRFGSGGQEQKKDFAQAERRRNAISYLDNPELLMIWAQSKGDSIAGARQHWMKVLCGFDDADPQGKNKQPPHFSQRYHHSSRHPGHHYHHAQPSRGAAGSSSSHQYYGQHH